MRPPGSAQVGAQVPARRGAPPGGPRPRTPSGFPARYASGNPTGAIPVLTSEAATAIDGRTVHIPGPLGPSRIPQGFNRRPAAPPAERPLRLRRLRLVEKFGGRRLHHHASLWRRIRSFVGIVFIGLVIAAIVASVIAVIVGAIALAVQHALH